MLVTQMQRDAAKFVAERKSHTIETETNALFFWMLRVIDMEDAPYITFCIRHKNRVGKIITVSNRTCELTHEFKLMGPLYNSIWYDEEILANVKAIFDELTEYDVKLCIPKSGNFDTYLYVSIKR